MATREELDALIRSYCADLRESHAFTADTLRQSDSLLNWTVGLLGAGLFAAPTFLSSLGVSLADHRLSIVVLLPWVFGILFGVAGRILALELREADDLRVGAKLHTIGALTLSPEPDADKLGGRFTDLLNDRVAPHTALAERAKRFQWWTRFCYYLLYVALGLGTLAIVGLAIFASHFR